MAAVSRFFGNCRKFMRMSDWRPVLTRTGCVFAGKPLGKMVLSERGSGSSGSLTVALTLSMGTGRMK